MRALLRTEVWVAKAVPQANFERSFKRKFPKGRIVSVVESADPKGHRSLRCVEVETFSDEREQFWQFFWAFAKRRGFNAEPERRTLPPRVLD